MLGGGKGEDRRLRETRFLLGRMTFSRVDRRPISIRICKKHCPIMGEGNFGARVGECAIKAYALFNCLSMSGKGEAYFQ